MVAGYVDTAEVGHCNRLSGCLFAVIRNPAAWSESLDAGAKPFKTHTALLLFVADLKNMLVVITTIGIFVLKDLFSVHSSPSHIF